VDKSVVTWLWKGNRDYRPHHVNVLASMFRRHLSAHRFICITDMDSGFDDGVEVMPMPEAAKDLGKFRTMEGSWFPSCYRRLWMFSDEARCLGDRVLLVDIDMVLTGSVDHLFDSHADFVGWQPKAEWGGHDRIGGGIYLLRTGSHTEVYEDFEGLASIAQARMAGFRGSDQAWMSYKLFGKVELFPEDSGIYSVRDLGEGSSLPSDACLIQFNGKKKPWDYPKPKWVDSHWRENADSQDGRGRRGDRAPEKRGTRRTHPRYSKSTGKGCRIGAQDSQTKRATH